MQWRRLRMLAFVFAGLALATQLATAAAVAASNSEPIQELADRYSPIVVVRDQPGQCGAGEPFLPLPVEAVLGRDDVLLVGPAGERIPAPTALDLADRGPGWYLDLPGKPLSPGCDYETWTDSLTPAPPATVYARVATDPEHPEVLALQYWFWWVFNDWNDRHEGDWEMVQLLFEAATPEEALAVGPSSVAYAQHEGSEVAPWTDPKLLREGDHVVVYPAQGSHAAYFTQSLWFGRSAAAGFGCDDTSAPGVEVKPDVVLLPTEAQPRFTWLSFTGRWGEKAPSFNNGPTGPNTKDQWTSPVTWQVDEGRDAAVALPVIGGPAVDSFCGLTQGASLLFIAALDTPLLVLGIIAILLVLAALLARGTRWRHGGDTRPDRERRAGQVVSASFGLLFRRQRELWPIVVVLALVTAGGLGLQRLLLHRRPSDDLTDLYGVAASPWRFVAVVAVSWVLAPIVAVGLAATCRVVEGVARDHRISGWAALTWAVRRPAAAVVQVVLFVAVTLLASSLALLPLALLLIAFFAVAMPAAMIEDRGVIAAFRRSSELTRGRRWRAVFLSALLVWIGFSLPGALGGILLLITGWPFWVSNLLSIVAGAVLLPFSAIGLTLQFYDFRQEWVRDQKSLASTSSTPRSAS